MSDHWRKLALTATGASAVEYDSHIQSLWSGYGEIFRVRLANASCKTLIIKQITPPTAMQHPRGWNTDLSYRRKLRSYEVEQHWYQCWNHLHDTHCRIARCYGLEKQALNAWILLEDLDASGYPIRHDTLTLKQARPCIRWLAHFHATHLQSPPGQLWATGSYWHLDTRPEELAAMPEGELKSTAQAISSVLHGAMHQTIIHGDAKVANFCFSNDGKSVAAVDFQYAGKGCGMIDLAYFIGSCMDSRQCELDCEEILDYYFTELSTALPTGKVNLLDIEREWRNLFEVAWTDFYRFMAGWMPTHRKINRYTRQLATSTLARIDIQLHLNNQQSS